MTKIAIYKKFGKQLYNFLDERSVVDRYCCHMTATIGVCVDEDHDMSPTLYWGEDLAPIKCI